MNAIIPAADRIVTKGDNLPALDETLPNETAELRDRAENLKDSASRAVCKDEETAQRCVLLAGLLKDFIKSIDQARVARKEPYLSASRAIDAHYNGIAGLLVTTDGKGKPNGGPLHGVLVMLDEYRREQECKAETERLRLEAEARKAREVAEAAERERQAALAAGERETARDAAAAANAANAEAERMQRQAASTHALPVTSVYGPRAGRRIVWRVEITDLRKAAALALRINPVSMQEAVQKVIEAQVRAGVRSYPDNAGVRVVEDSTTVVRT